MSADAEGEEASREGQCIKDVVRSLINAKGTSSTQLQLAINSSLMQVAKKNFDFVTFAIFSALENEDADHQRLQLLRLLSQLLEQRDPRSLVVPRTLAKNMTRHLLSNPGQPSADVLCELAPMHPDLVLGEVLQGLSSDLPSFSLELLSQVAAASPATLKERLNEVLSKCFNLLQGCRVMDVRLLLLRTWCSLCTAIVSCLFPDASPLDAGHPCFSRHFAVAASPMRVRQTAADPDGRKTTQVISAVFALLMSSWTNWKDQNLRVAVVDTLGHLSLVIPKDQFLTNADALLEHIVFLLSRQGLASSSSPMPPFALMQGTCLALQACVDADRELLTIENTFQTLWSALFNAVVAGGPLQYLHGLGQEALQSQAELLRCMDVLAENFGTESLNFLLQKAKGHREERLAALLVLRQFAGSLLASGIVEGVQPLLSDTDAAVGIMLGELLVALSPRLAEVAASKQTQVNNLIGFVIRLTARAQVADTEHGYIPKFVSKGYSNNDAPSAEEVRKRAGSVLGQLAGDPRGSMNLALWPLLLKAMVNPSMLLGLPIICRCVTQMVQSERDAAEREDAPGGGVRQAFQNYGQSDMLLLWLLVCAHAPIEPIGLGTSILRCLEALAVFLHPILGQIWEAPSKRLQTLCGHLEEASFGARLEGDLWVSAMAQEIDFFLSALPDHDELPEKFIEILCGFLEKVKKERDSPLPRAWDVGGGQSDLTDAQRAGIFNLTGVCLGHSGNVQRATAALELLVGHAAELGRASRRAFARGLGFCASRHLEVTLTAIAKGAKADSNRRGASLQNLFGKSTAAQTAEQLRATLLLSLGFCAINTPGPMLLQEKVCERILKPLHQALVQEKARDILRHAVEAISLVGDALRCPQERRMECDPFLADTTEVSLPETLLAALSEDSPTREALTKHRNELLEALLPLIDVPKEQDFDKMSFFDEMICPSLDAIGSLTLLPLELPPELFGLLMEHALQVLAVLLPQEEGAASGGSVGRIKAVTGLMKALLFHVHNWLGISRLLQAVHKVGAKSHVETVRWMSVQIIGDLCRVAPIVAPAEGEGHNDLGDWCECLALLLPRMGDSSKAVASASIDCIQQLLARCELTATLRVGSPDEYLTLPQDTSALLGDLDVDSGLALLRTEGEELRGDPAPPSQQLVGSLLVRLPDAMPTMVQHLMLAMHDVDSHAAMTGVDAMHLLLRSCEFSPEATGNIVSSLFSEVEKVRHSSVRQLVLSCVKVLAMQHFEKVIEELLETGPDFNMCIMGALQVMVKENTLLLKLLNHFTAILNHSDPGLPKEPTRKVLSATIALGHLFTVNDSSIGAAVKKYFAQLFGTFLLRIGTTTEGLSAQQAAAAFMNFLHASQNDSMAMALEGNRLAKVTKEFYDEVICELVSLYCRHQPRRREKLLQFLQPFLASELDGHRVAAVTTMSQLLLSCIDNAMEAEVVNATLNSVVVAIGDPDSTVRKQAVRGLGNVANLWHYNWEEPHQVKTEEIMQEVLQHMCRLLSDEAAAVRREAVVAMQRACQVPCLPFLWQHFLLVNSPQHLPQLLDAEDTLLRGASLDLLGRLSELAATTGNDAEVDFSVAGLAGAPQVPSRSLDAFIDSLLLMVVQCTIRLEDSSSAVAAAASRCLRHITGIYIFFQTASRSRSSEEAEEAWELLQRLGQAQIDFEQFIFPFVAVLHLPNREDVALKRLQLCQRYLALKPQDFVPPGAPPRTH